MTDARSPRPPRAGDPYGIGPVRARAAPILSVVGLLVVALVTLSLLNGEVPFVGGKTGRSNGNGNGNGNGGPHADRRPRRTSSSSREVDVPGLDRLRQGRQHLGPDRQGRPPADEQRRRLDAVVVAGRPVRSTSSDDQGRDRDVAGRAAATRRYA